MVDLFRYQHWDLVSKRGIYYTFSGLLLIAGLFMLFTKGLNRGIDFRGGGLVTYSVKGQLPDHAKIIHDLRGELVQAGEAANDQGLKSAEVQIATSGANDQVLIRTMLIEKSESQQNQVLAKQIETSITPAVTDVVTKAGRPAPTLDSKDVVSGSISSELMNMAIIAVILGSLLIMGWIGLRYNIGGMGFKYSAAGILALLHDLAILVGMFAILHNYLQVNSPFIAALLTVLGYSIHDTIVIFDRIRENIRLRKGRTFAETVNISLLETMARSVNTILTVLFTLLALFFFGGSTLRDFTAAMLIGVIVGGYSSIFIASQLLVTWAKGQDRIILPLGAKVATAAASIAASVAQPVTAGSAPSKAPEPVVTMSAAAPNREAIQRARQAGKTSKRRR
ncbi:MAG TPA: protein translocase subunit SecF [Armatimonadota bacterium]|nr:protein translocase subunit SecF [Armatimonadota bacterium]